MSFPVVWVLGRVLDQRLHKVYAVTSFESTSLKDERKKG